MAELTITVASVVPSANERVDTSAKAGETITAGMSVYQKSTDSRWWKAQADGTTEEAGVAVQKGISMHASLAGQPLAVQTGGDIVIGATIAAGVFYFVGTTAGAIGLSSDLGSTNKVTMLGYGISTTVLRLLPTATGVVLA